MSVFRSSIAAVAAAALFVAAAGSSRAALVIDNYDVGAQSIMLTTGTANNSLGMLAPDVLGGTRSLDLTITANPNMLSSSLVVLPVPGIVTLSNDVGVASVASATYDANGAGLGGVDLAAAGTQFEFNILAVDLTLSITIEVTDGNAVTSTKTLSGLMVGNATFAFASFVGGADFTDVEKIKVIWTAPDSADFAADFFGVTNVVPEPASLALVATGLAGLAARRRLRAAK